MLFITIEVLPDAPDVRPQSIGPSPSREPHPPRASWTRNEARASEALEQFLTQAEHPWLGYVGDWHTHPAPVGPGHTDKRSIQRAARSIGHPLALIVHRSDATLDVLAVRHGIVGRIPWTTYQHDYQEEAP